MENINEIYISDLDNDGKNEIALGYSKYLSVLDRNFNLKFNYTAKGTVKGLYIGDINNDSITEYISISCDLDYRTPDTPIIQGKIFNINPFEVEKINITHSVNWSFNDFFLGSYPEIMNLDSNIQIYTYSISSGWGSQPGIYR